MASYFERYEFSNFSDFFRFFQIFFNFIIAHVTWQLMERPIVQKIATVDRHLRWGMGGTDNMLIRHDNTQLLMHSKT